MILALDVGNTQIFGGIFEGDSLLLTFRKSSKTNMSSDELGVFLKGVLRENDITVDTIDHIAISSVVPDLIYTLRGCCKKYFTKEPFIIGPGIRTGLSIRYKNPLEVGADRIVNSVAAMNLFPGKNLIIIDFGTANTFCVVTYKKEYLGGLILPGIRLSMEALVSHTAKLPAVEINMPKRLVGQTTEESIQSGLYYGNLSAMKLITQGIKKEYLDNGHETLVIGTGGFAKLFEQENIFNKLIPNLVLEGLNIIVKLNI